MNAPQHCPDAVIPVGHWLPTAAILCDQCARGAARGASDFYRKETEGRTVEWRADTWYGATLCNQCDRWIAVRSDVADLNNLRRRLGAGEMSQTGGMCAALEFLGDDGDPGIMVTANDGPYLACRYAAVDRPEQYNWEEPELLIEDMDIDKVIAALQSALPWLKEEQE